MVVHTACRKKFIFFGLAFSTLAPTICPTLFPLAFHFPERFQLLLLPWTWAPFSHLMLTLFCLEHHPSHPHMLKSYPSFKTRSSLAPVFPSLPLIPTQPNPTSLASHDVSISKLAVAWELGFLHCSHHCLAHHHLLPDELQWLHLGSSCFGLGPHNSQKFCVQNVNQLMPFLCLILFRGFLWHLASNPNSFPWPPRPQKSRSGHCFEFLSFCSLTLVTVFQTLRSSTV